MHNDKANHPFGENTKMVIFYHDNYRDGVNLHGSISSS